MLKIASSASSASAAPSTTSPSLEEFEAPAPSVSSARVPNRVSVVATSWFANCLSKCETNSALLTSPPRNWMSLQTLRMRASLSSDTLAACSMTKPRPVGEFSPNTCDANSTPAGPSIFATSAANTALSSSLGASSAASSAPLPSEDLSTRMASLRKRSGTLKALDSASARPPLSSNLVTSERSASLSPASTMVLVSPVAASAASRCQSPVAKSSTMPSYSGPGPAKRPGRCPGCFSVL
mmetsp:Transcript_167032/g.536336  ORF Transcript_167032/g.536336 Transcript_167032/m.536336 type:complete len:239 (-) Transcript_167032:372-1088(-)